MPPPVARRLPDQDRSHTVVTKTTRLDHSKIGTPKLSYSYDHLGSDVGVTIMSAEASAATQANAAPYPGRCAGGPVPAQVVTTLIGMTGPTCPPTPGGPTRTPDPDRATGFPLGRPHTAALPALAVIADGPTWFLTPCNGEVRICLPVIESVVMVQPHDGRLPGAHHRWPARPRRLSPSAADVVRVSRAGTPLGTRASNRTTCGKGLIQPRTRRPCELRGLGSRARPDERRARMWWIRRKPGEWAASCRDIADRRREILIVPTENERVAVIVPPGEIAVLEPLEAGRLVGALRDAVRALDHPETQRAHQHAIPTVRASA